ncbi:MAG TPA: ATP-binding protein [Kofleriaceae bacterium]|nr:ATP-binding protein [Kofleriaceae bacterium]
MRDCLAIAPAARPTAEDLVRRITTLLDPCASIVPERCPFPGLAAFSRGGAADYFGRDAELDTLVEQLGRHALIPVVGPSGIGKSSLIRAGLFPRLERTGSWVTMSLRLDGSPFHRLAAALGSPDQTVGELAESLREDPDYLSLALRNVAKRHDAQVLLFLDKFEELCKLAAPQDDLMAFCDCLARAASGSNPWRIVLALRDDFLDRLTAVPSMRPHLPAVMVLGPLSRANLSAAIYGPLANVNYRADIPELVTHIVDEIAEEPASLPLLQLTCKALWERRDVATRQILTIEYKAMGGATGALGTYAQGLVADLTHEEVHLVRRMLLSLVHPDGTRRRRLRTEVLDGIPAASRPVARALLDRLLDRRLVIAAQDSRHHPAQLEIVHEALAMAWPQLGTWFDETYEGFNMTYEERP